MKAKLLIFAVTAVMMAFTACIKERIVYVEKESPTSGIELQPGEGIVKISLAEGMSRAARPVVSSEGTSDINTIAFKFYRFNDYTEDISGEVVAAYSDAEGKNSIGSVNDPSTEPKNIITFENGLKAINTLYIKIKNLQKAGEYHIFAYGYNESIIEQEEEGEQKGGGQDLSVTFSGEKFIYDASSYQNKDGSPTRINHIDQEIFAGHVQTVTNEHGLFSQEVSMKLERQVAGLLAYLSDVPVYVKATEGDLAGKNVKVTKITIETGLTGINSIKFPDDTDFNGVKGSYGRAKLLTFDITKLTDNSFGIGDKYDNISLDGKKYLLAEEMQGITLPEDFACDDNTLFGGCFLCPFVGHQEFSKRSDMPDDFATLNIVYYGNDTNGKNADTEEVELLRLPLKTNNIPSQTDLLNTGEYGSLEYQYDIRRNNFYSIGTKETPTNPDDDDANKDAPLPIDPGSGIEQFEVIIDEAWKESHDLNWGNNE